MIRSTTNGTLKSYRYNLQCSSYHLNQARNTVLTQRNFNSFAESPADAARCFQLRRSFLRTNSQYDINESVGRKYDVAWSAIDSVVQDVSNRLSDSALAEIVAGNSDATASGRNALGQSLEQLAEGIVQTMNTRYGDNYVFSGADGLNVPFTWETAADGTKTLHYRGVSVDTQVPDVEMDANNEPVGYLEDGTKVTDPAVTPTHYKKTDGTMIEIPEYDRLKADMAKLDYMINDEKKYADLGLGIQEDENGEIIDSSAFNVALQGITFLGYGVDEDGDPKNIASIITRMGEILLNCDEDGNFADGDKDEFNRLFGKFTAAADIVENKHTEMDTEAAFLQSNQTQLKNTAYTLQEQFLGIEDADLADAITAFSWAQYCYNAALKVGNSILSESLMDYLRT